MALLTASELSVSYADIDIFSGVSLEINQGDRIGMVGPNGGGKTSLIKVLVGEETPDYGQIHTAN
ncbi:MAG: ATP-binding cassette domain-containing protein, partial [Chloroflexota bacterium]|nr:ATP-binding cassette domain-containing protein [Chloroflexota bacterium]